MDFGVALKDIEDAAKRIQGHAHVTPVLSCKTLDTMAGKHLRFKCENFQKAGAFKFRGACNSIFKLTPEEAKRGVVTYSSGNHAQALALAASLRGVKAHIVMPENAPAVKVRSVEGYGATVYKSSTALGAREQLAEKLLKETGGILIPPYDHYDVIAGQGTLALEWIKQCQSADAPLDALVICIGGGGLISGVALAAKSVNPNIRIFAAEPLEANDWALSFAAGKPIGLSAPSHTIADGLRTPAPGKLTWPIVSKLVEKVITVREDEIKTAMRLLWERMKVVVEPSGAVPFAAVLTEEFKAIHNLKNVGVLISGGNVDLDVFKW